jgi:PhnB protein
VKCYTQAYIRGSIEAAEMYCKAFNAEITFQIKDENGT